MTVLGDVLKKKQEAVDAIREPEGAPLVPPTTAVIADLTGGDSSSAPEREPEEGEPGAPAAAEPTPEAKKAKAAAKKAAPAPEPVVVSVAAGAVTFVCDQWAGVRLFGTGIKFENHLFTTSDAGEISRLDAWEHAERA